MLNKYNALILKMDATCANAEVRYPVDVDIIHDGCKVVDRYIHSICKALNISDQRTSYKNARRAYLILVKMKKKGGRLVRLTKSYMLSCLDFWLHFLLYGYKRDFEFFRPVWSEILIQ